MPACMPGCFHSPLGQKLGIRAGHRVTLVDAPVDLWSGLEFVHRGAS